VRTAGAEAALRVIVHHGAGRGAKHFGQHADVGFRGCRGGLERWRVGQCGLALAFRTLVHPAPRVVGAEGHHQRAVAAHRPVERRDQPERSALDGPQPAHRRMHHQRVPGAHPECRQVLHDRRNTTCRHTPNANRRHLGFWSQSRFEEYRLKFVQIYGWINLCLDRIYISTLVASSRHRRWLVART
jgi:hypothetical protein